MGLLSALTLRPAGPPAYFWGGEKPRLSGAFPQSGRRDLNSGPLVPQTSALTRLRHAPCPATIADAPRILVARTHRPTPLQASKTRGRFDAGHASRRGRLHRGRPEGAARRRRGVHVAPPNPGRASAVSDGQPLDTLIRLFFVGDQVSWQDAAAALPGLDPDRLVAAGVLEARRRGLQARPCGWFRTRTSWSLRARRRAAGGIPPPGEPDRPHALRLSAPGRGRDGNARPPRRAAHGSCGRDRGGPRALTLIRLGALLNALDNLEAVEGERSRADRRPLLRLDRRQSAPRPLARRGRSRRHPLPRARQGSRVAPERGRLRPRPRHLGPRHGRGLVGRRSSTGSPASGATLSFSSSGRTTRPDTPLRTPTRTPSPRWTGFLRDLAADSVASGAIVLRRRSRGTNWAATKSSRRRRSARRETSSSARSSTRISSPRSRPRTSCSTRSSPSSSRSASSRSGATRTKGSSSRAHVPASNGASASASASTRTRSSFSPASTGARRLRELFAEIARDSQLEEEVVARAGLPAVRRLLELGFLARAS